MVDWRKGGWNLRGFARRHQIERGTLDVIGVYAGLVIIGSGSLILAALVLLTGCDLREGNAMKAFILLLQHT